MRRQLTLYVQRQVATASELLSLPPPFSFSVSSSLLQSCSAPFGIGWIALHLLYYYYLHLCVSNKKAFESSPLL
jgi:hypothetical protein